MGLFEGLQTWFALASLLDFTVTVFVRLLVFKFRVELGREEDERHSLSNRATNSAVLLRFTCCWCFVFLFVFILTLGHVIDFKERGREAEREGETTNVREKHW